MFPNLSKETAPLYPENGQVHGNLEGLHATSYSGDKKDSFHTEEHSCSV